MDVAYACILGIGTGILTQRAQHFAKILKLHVAMFRFALGGDVVHSDRMSVLVGDKFNSSVW